jgi:dTDP-4-dehydrorhamnose 3,5-epimerase
MIPRRVGAELHKNRSVVVVTLVRPPPSVKVEAVAPLPYYQNKNLQSVFPVTSEVPTSSFRFRDCLSLEHRSYKNDSHHLNTCTLHTLRSMELIETPLKDVKLIRPKRFGDDRGWFAEVFNQETFSAAGLPDQFVQDNQSFSTRGVLRGLHYQLGRPQGKLVRVLSGTIWDVAVDLRATSPNFGKWTGFFLTAPTVDDPVEMLWIPEGFAHGFLVVSETAEVLYKTTNLYHPAGERCILWNDPQLAIDWPLDGIVPSISPKDVKGTLFSAAELPPA